MNIFGIGGGELVLIIIIMLVVAGPQRMIRWMYVLGRYVAVLQRMWAEAAATLQKEFDDAGVDIKVPEKIPTKGDIQRQIGSAMNPLAKPIQDVGKELQEDIDGVRKATQFKPHTPVTKAPAQKMRTPAPNAAASNGAESAPNEANTPDFGTWSDGGNPS
jgi:Sec-independent protein translocase protein TatA